MPEGRHVFAGLTVMENLEMGAFLHTNKEENAALLKKVFQRFPRLEERKNQDAATLSGGEQQMLAMGRALMSRPKLLLLDEHTAALDPATAEKVMDITKTIVQENNITTMMITHNLKQSLTTGTRTIMLDSGEIILDLSGEERKNTTMEDMIKMYSMKKQKEFDNDRILLSQ